MNQLPNVVKLSPLQMSELGKVATDQSFDLSHVVDGNWLLCRSTQFSERVWLTVMDSKYQLANDLQHLMDELSREGMSVQKTALQPADAKGTVQLAEYSELYQLLGRVAALVKTTPNRLVEEFVAVTLSMPESTEVERLAKQRVGQDIFRNALISFWQGRCAVTGLSVVSLLRASHI